ncbi:MAG: hypothetical protein QXJ11_02915 [Candidatus Bathyarchaeia archaeon]
MMKTICGFVFTLFVIGVISTLSIQTITLKFEGTHEVKAESSSNYYVFTMEIMGENYTIAIETDGTVGSFHYSNFTFGWVGVGNSYYNITIPKSLNNTQILARSSSYQGAFEPDEISMNATHYFVYYSDWWVNTLSDIFFGAPYVRLSIGSSTTYVGFTVNIEADVTYRGKPLANWPVIIVAYTAPLRGDVWAWQWMSLPLTLIGTGNTTQDGVYSVVWMPTASGTWWISAGLANPWPPTNGDYPEEASDSLSLNVIPHADAVFSVVSNATVSGLTFNSTTMELSFTVEGSSETMGFIDVFISKTLLEDPSVLEVYLNVTRLSSEQFTVSSMDESWRLHLEITFSSKYYVSIVIPEFPSTILILALLILTASTIILYKNYHKG